MSRKAHLLDPVFFSDGRQFPVNPLYELENRTLAGVELPRLHSLGAGLPEFDILTQALRKDLTALDQDGFLCSPMGADELADPRFPRNLARACRSHGANPASLCLFFPDQACLRLGAAALDTLLTLKRLGFRLGLDIVSLDHTPGLFVERLPVDVLRLDPLDAIIHPDDPDILRSIKDFTQFADNLLMLPAARGVRSEGQLHMLKGLGVRLGQGPLFS